MVPKPTNFSLQVKDQFEWPEDRPVTQGISTTEAWRRAIDMLNETDAVSRVRAEKAKMTLLLHGTSHDIPMPVIILCGILLGSTAH